MSQELHWKVIYVSSRSEKKVSERLLQSGIECYVPLKKELRQWSDRKKMVVTPLINGYVFVRPTPLQRDKVLEQAGAIQYVRHNGADALVKEAEIETLRSVETKGYHAEGHFGAALKIGDQAVIQHGPFKGLRGFVKSTASEDIYYVAIESIDFCLTLRAPREILSHAGR